MFTPKTRVAITDDSPEAISGLVQQLQLDTALKLTGIYGEGIAVLHGLNGNHTDVLLLRDHLITYGRRNLVTDLQYLHPTLHIVILVSDDEFKADPVRAALRGKARACLITPQHHDLINDTVHAVAKGHFVLPDEVRSRLDAAEKRKMEALTAHELVLLDLISDEYSQREIALELDIPPERAKAQCDALLQKMQVRNFAGLVRLAMSKGLI